MSIASDLVSTSLWALTALSVGCGGTCDGPTNATWLKRVNNASYVARLARRAPEASHACMLRGPTIGQVVHNGGLCVALLLDASTLLTAAHCLGANDEGESFQPSEGAPYSGERLPMTRIGRRCVHPRYAPGCVGVYDLAVGRLDRPADITVVRVELIGVENAADLQGVALAAAQPVRGLLGEEIATIQTYDQQRFPACVRTMLEVHSFGQDAEVVNRTSARGGTPRDTIDLIDRPAPFGPHLLGQDVLVWSGAPIYVPVPDGPEDHPVRVFGVVSHGHPTERGLVTGQGLSFESAWIRAAAEALASDSPHPCPQDP